MRRIEYAIKRAYGSQFTVEVFGSSRYGMDKGDSDLDLVICVRITVLISVVLRLKSNIIGSLFAEWFPARRAREATAYVSYFIRYCNPLNPLSGL